MKLKNPKDKPLTFADLEPGSLFTGNGKLYRKVTACYASPLDGSDNTPVSGNEFVYNVYRPGDTVELEVTAL